MKKLGEKKVIRFTSQYNKTGQKSGASRFFGIDKTDYLTEHLDKFEPSHNLKARYQAMQIVTAQATAEAPFEPIQLTLSGHKLLPWTAADPSLVQEQSTLPTVGDILGNHALCDGQVRIHEATMRAHAMVCEKCYFRREYPNGLKTFADLREHFTYET